VKQIVTLDETAAGVATNYQNTVTFTIIVTDPCKTTIITPENNEGQAFYYNNAANPLLTTSRLYGSDTVADGIPSISDPTTTPPFVFHWDSVSTELKPADDSMVCGPRLYSVAPVNSITGSNNNYVQVDSSIP
jgi:hypothetical protein